MSNRAYNFNPGPAALPFEVLQKAQVEFMEYKGTGMSVMEISHRSAEFEQLNDETQRLMLELLGAPAGYKVLFLQGGASTQFATIPMNLLKPEQVGAYVITGSWGNKAIKEARLIGEASVIASSKEAKFNHIPALSKEQIPSNAAYVHVTSNETIEGVQFKHFPDTGNVPLIADMSSDIMCKPIDVSKFSMIYAGAQKNLGPSGVTIAIVKEDLFRNIPEHVPTMLRYDTHIDNDSLYNTPPVYSIYMVNLVLKWIKENGGLATMEQKNIEKTNLIYNAMDQSNGFYYGPVDKQHRSIMNVTFRLKDEDLEQQFIQEALAFGFVGIKGHRSVGGLRASTYNAVPYESCKALSDFMVDFYNKHA